MESAWDPLLARLAEVPRENGTGALDATATFLVETLRQAGVTPEVVTFVAHPWRLRAAGLLALAGGLLYRRLLRGGKPYAALAVALLFPTLLLAELDAYLPLLGWLHAVPQQHVVARVGAAAPAQELLLVAHYDTKTDLLDHVERAPVDLLGPLIVACMVAGALLARRRPGVARLAGILAPLYGLALCLVLSAGALVRQRSPGALDDGAACAVLVRLAERLAAGPPLARTAVEVSLLSGEEIGVEGSWVWARRRFPAPPALPTAVVNLEGIGAVPDLAVLGRESFTLRGWPPDASLVALLDDVHRTRRGRGLHRTWYGGATDARSFLARGVPAATLLSDPGRLFPRGLHSAEDVRARLDPDALDATLDYLEAVVRTADARGLAPH